MSSSGAITWDPTQYIDISPGDGEDITGIKRSPRALLVFKPNHIYRIFGIYETDPDPQIPVGTYSQESVVEGKDGYYFHDYTNSAIHRYTGSLPEEISKPIRPYLEGVSLTNRTKVAGWKDNDHIYESVGNITLNDVVFINVVIAYTISTKVWQVYSYPTQFLQGVLYDDGSTIDVAVADNDGSVHRFNNGTTDNGAPISFSLVTRWYDLGQLRSYKKGIEKLGVLNTRAQGAMFQYQVDNPSTENEWNSVGQLTKEPVHHFDTDIYGNRVRFRLSGSSVGEPFIYSGIEIIKGFAETVTN